MSTASSLPPDWLTILDDIQIRLDQAIALAANRLAQMPNLDNAVTEETKHQEIADWHSRLQRMQEFLDSAEQVVQSVDEILQKEENNLRQQLITSGTVRQKLAASPARAIG